MAEKDTIVGLPEPDAGGGIYQFLSMLSPTEFSVVEPRKSSYIDDMGGYYLVKPGQYKFEGFATPQIVTAGIDAFKAFVDDPVEATKSGVAGAVEGFADEIRKGIVAANTGVTETFDPKTETFDRFDPLSLTVAAGAPIAYGTARSIKAMADADGVAVGMLGGKDKSFLASMKLMRRSADVIRKNPDREQAFDATAFLQRGAPETKMRELQSYMGPTPMASAIEQGGDLLHRMMEYGGDYSYNAKSKIKTLVADLNRDPDRPSLEEEFNFNIPNNYRINLQTSRERGEAPKATTLEEFEGTIDEGLAEYALLHSNLPVFNELQLAARNVAVALGRKNFDEARYHLSILDRAIDDGSFDARNLEFDPDFESKAASPGSNYTVLGMLGGGRGGRPVTVRSLGGGKGGIKGLAHGVKFYDRMQKVPDNLKEAFFGGKGGGIASLYDKDGVQIAPSERYAISPNVIGAAAGANMTLGDLVKEFGLSNRVRNIVSDNRASSAEIYRPGFSIGTDPVLSLSTFTMSEISGKPARDRTEGMVAIEPKEQLFVKTGVVDDDGYPVYAPRELTMHDVQNLSPSQYLLAAYDPDKPLLKKPNTKYNESEIHIAEDAAHSMNVRELTDREEEDLVTALNFEQDAVTAAERAVVQEFLDADGDPSNTKLDTAVKSMALAVENPAGIGQKNLAYIETQLGKFATRLFQSQNDGAIDLTEIYPVSGGRLFNAADKFSRTQYLLENGPYKRAVRQEGADTQTEILRNSLTGPAAKYGEFFEFVVPNDERLPIELKTKDYFQTFTTEQRSLLSRIEMARMGRLFQTGLLGNKPADAKKLTDRFLRTPNAEAIVELFGYIDNDGVFRRNLQPYSDGNFPEVGSPRAILEGDLKKQFLDVKMNAAYALDKIHAPRDVFEARVNQISAVNIRPVLMQIYDSNTDRERAFSGQINKGRQAQAYNQLYRQYRDERDELISVLKEAANEGALDVTRPTRLDARLAADDTYSAFKAAVEERSRRGELTGASMDLYENIVDRMRLGPRPGSGYARLMPQEVDKKPYKYEEGGEVVSPDRALDLVADAINKTGRMPLFLKRALNPKTPMTEGKETIRLAHDRIGDRFMVYPTLFPMNTPDGPRLTELTIQEARQKALDSGEYLIFDTEAEASTVAEGFSREIGVDNRPVQGGGVGDFIPYMVQ